MQHLRPCQVPTPSIKKSESWKQIAEPTAPRNQRPNATSTASPDPVKQSKGPPLAPCRFLQECHEISKDVRASSKSLIEPVSQEGENGAEPGNWWFGLVVAGWFKHNLRRAQAGLSCLCRNLLALRFPNRKETLRKPRQLGS